MQNEHGERPETAVEACYVSKIVLTNEASLCDLPLRWPRCGLRRSVFEKASGRGS
jgi:hypothetical protein